MIRIDLEAGVVHEDGPDGSVTHRLDTAAGFEIVSKAWLRAGWDAKHVYSFTWLGRPVIQLPDDLLRLQELIWSVQPDVIVETGVAHGGTTVFCAGLCRLAGRGRVIAVDVEIRPHNRIALEQHPLAAVITLLEGDSTAQATIEQVRDLIAPGETVLVLLDANHTRDHVARELEAYAPLVTPGSCIIAMDGIMGDLPNAPRTQPDWTWNNPREAARAFVAHNPDYAIVEPPFPFNEGAVERRVTYWPDGIIRRLR